MKKFQMLLLTLLLGIGAGAQNRKMYVSKHGGEKRFLLFGKVGYNNYMYHGGSGDCDSLVCSSKGFETCTIGRHMFTDKKDAMYTDTYNKVIRRTGRAIRRSKTSEGKFTCTINHYKAVVTYKNADYKRHDADIEIELM